MIPRRTLTPRQRQAFAQRGWLVVRGTLAAAALADLLQILEEQAPRRPASDASRPSRGALP